MVAVHSVSRSAKTQENGSNFVLIVEVERSVSRRAKTQENKSNVVLIAEAVHSVSRRAKTQENGSNCVQIAVAVVSVLMVNALSLSAAVGTSAEHVCRVHEPILASKKPRSLDSSTLGMFLKPSQILYGIAVTLRRIHFNASVIAPTSYGRPTRA